MGATQAMVGRKNLFFKGSTPQASRLTTDNFDPSAVYCASPSMKRAECHGRSAEAHRDTRLPT